MGLLDTMKQTNEQQSTTEMLEEWTSRLPAVEQQLSKPTKTVADLTGLRESDGRAARGPDEASVDLAAARAALKAAARQRDQEQDRRDREDARRRRITVEQQRSREAARRVVSAQGRLGCALDDGEDREAARNDSPEFG